MRSIRISALSVPWMCACRAQLCASRHTFLPSQARRFVHTKFQIYQQLPIVAAMAFAIASHAPMQCDSILLIIWRSHRPPCLSVGCAKNEAAPAAAAAPPPTVAVDSGRRPRRSQVASEWITTLDGYANAQIRPQVSGYLVKRNYREGAIVRKGEVLFEVDARPFAGRAGAGRGAARAKRARSSGAPSATSRATRRSRKRARHRAEPAGQRHPVASSRPRPRSRRRKPPCRRRAAQSSASRRCGRSSTASPASRRRRSAISSARRRCSTTVSQVDPIRAYFSLSEQEYLHVAGQINTADASQGPVEDRRRR